MDWDRVVPAQVDAAVLASAPFLDGRLVDAGDPAAPDHRYFAKLVRLLRPAYVVELGTGRGRTAAQVMAALPQYSRFTTINWPNPPSGDDVGAELAPWAADVRLWQLLGDTRDPDIAAKVEGGVDLLYIDSGTRHEYALISEEWCLYAPKLTDGALVVCDDINHNDMRRFWDPLPYDKCEVWGGSAGMFRYDRGACLIDDLRRRREHWDRPENRAPREEHDLTDSLPYPFEPVAELFDGKRVLEIGPGRGRQHARLKDRVSAYSVCDISPAALAEPLFVGLSQYLLSDYATDFGVRFDVVHFWYVLHHVKLGELDDFFRFVARHLHPGGLAIFNGPQDGNARGWYADDGLGTSWLTSASITAAYAPYLATVEARRQDERSSGTLFVAMKREGSP